MNQPSAQLVAQTAAYVQQTLQHAEGGHDWWHTLRVWNNAKLIASTEDADLLIVELAALLHDIADSKFHGGDENIGPETAAQFLQSLNVQEHIIYEVRQIIACMSFKAGFDRPSYHSKELEIVQDADRLDAIGAIGIARAFNYGGFKGREIYNPEIPPILDMTKEQYKNSTAPTINHFYEKLLLLKDKMNTPTARRLAEQRHTFMLNYLEQFYAEWEGKV
ncbi:HD domain-containing protein [Mucilaginibacter robiniae]|uniref:HD domain-containing protein n=1 Tax=Mucilaginibacter robiniae TaxID=2728022 RepID=A0A7L5E422_9SPHI|nr:HD domain-containing protein [Mucilaginibacter robiniae]QJD95573.1 HD domain-containing protein [Mucilaginibacter robiniae]